MMVAMLAGLALAAAEPAGPAPERMALARTLIDASGGQARVAQAMSLTMNTLFSDVRKNIPPEQARFTALIQSDFQAQVVTLAPALVELTERIYAENLTEKEMRDELAWLQSDSGRAIQRKSPVILQQTLQAVVPMVQARMPQIMQGILQRICTQTTCTPQDRQVLSTVMAKAARHPG